MNERTFPRLHERFYEERLPNGLCIRVIPKPGFSRAFAVFAADYGSMDTAFTLDGEKRETPAGVAHYLEHKMFDMPDGDAMSVFAAAGASPNAFTSYAMTAYHFECTDRFEENLRTLLGFVSTPYFTPESVEKERGIIAQEIRMYEDSPGSRVYEDLMAAMFAHHPVRVPIAGTVESIQAITPETLYDCHRAFYDPSNMILCVAGDVDPERVAAVAREILPEAPGGVSARDYGETEPASAPVHETSREMDVAMPMFLLGFKCDPALRGRAALRQELLGDLAAELVMGESSPLYSRLYEAGLIDAGFSCGYEDVKSACVLSAAGDSRDPAAVRDAIVDEAARIVRDGPDEALFERLKKSEFGRRLRELDGFEGVCCAMADAYFRGEEYYDFPELYDELTAADAVEFLRGCMTPERMTLSVILPRQAEGEENAECSQP